MLGWGSRLGSCWSFIRLRITSLTRIHLGLRFFNLHLVTPIQSGCIWQIAKVQLYLSCIPSKWGKNIFNFQLRITMGPKSMRVVLYNIDNNKCSHSFILSQPKHVKSLFWFYSHESKTEADKYNFSSWVYIFGLLRMPNSKNYSRDEYNRPIYYRCRVSEILKSCYFP